MRAASRTVGYVAVFAFIFWVTSIVLAGLYARHLNTATERKFCAIIEASSPRDAPPPGTARSEQIVRAMRDLQRQLGCR